MKKSTKALLSASLVATLIMSNIHTPLANAEQTPLISPLPPAMENSDSREDIDKDGLTNREEETYGTTFDMADTDGDGLNDFEELIQYNTNPLQNDTDQDYLDDSMEIQLHLDPQNPDVDGDRILDGNVERSYTLPSNQFGMTGTMIGKSNVLKRVIIRENPNLALQEITSAKTFDIVSYDPNITFNLTIPYPENEEQEDLALFRYDTKSPKLIPIENQKLDKKSNILQVEFQGGGSFVAISKQVYKKSLKPDRAKKEKTKKFKGKAKVHGLPSIEINSDTVSTNDTFKIIKSRKIIEDVKSLEGNSVPRKKEITLTAEYRIKEVHATPEGETYLTVEAISPESGLTPTILVHGWNGSPNTWGFNTYWTNAGSASAMALYNVPSYLTFTKQSYSVNSDLPYNEIDPNFVTSNSNTSEFGPKLVSRFGYTPNVDLFVFQYYAPMSSGTVSTAAHSLSKYVYKLKNTFMWGGQVNLVGHSMGGLVSRYMIENIGTSNIRRLVTLGTPHFGSHLSPYGDLDRQNSQLWSSTSSNRLQNDAAIPYIGFGGWNPDYTALVSGTKNLRGLYATDLGTPNATYSSWDAYVRSSYRTHMGYDYGGNINDDVVRMDSALGSDWPISPRLPAVKMNKRFLIWHNDYGQHSRMRSYDLVQQYAYYALTGLYDNSTKD